MISIIIPTWNRADKIKKAIRSVQNQTISDWELLICDDGSTDNTDRLVKTLQNEDKRIKWIPGEHLGKPATPRNRGIKQAKGEWIAFLDSDDEWLPEKLEKQLKIIKEKKLMASSTNAFRLIPSTQEKKIYSRYHKSKILFKDLIKSNKIITSSVLIKKSIFKDDFYFPENTEFSVGEDYCLWLKIATQNDFAYIEEPLLTYRDDPKNSVRGLNTENDLIRRKRILFYILNFSFKKHINLTYKKLILKEILLNLYHLFTFQLKNIILTKY
jgi:glycosyltransferase involved in cell wall biosynthesis